MNKKLLLCTFSKTHLVDKKVYEIQEKFNILYGLMYVLRLKGKFNESIITYNVELDESELNYKNLISNTINLHRKKETNTLYTINALNEVIKEKNNGVLDNSFNINWDEYQNSILLYNKENELKIYKTSLQDVIRSKK